MAAVERLPALHYSVDFILFSFGIIVSLWNFDTIRGSLMKPKWQKLASRPRKYAHSSVSSLVQSLLPKDTLLRTYYQLSKTSILNGGFKQKRCKKIGILSLSSVRFSTYVTSLLFKS